MLRESRKPTIRILSALVAICSVLPAEAQRLDASPSAERQGVLRVVTYNVAGLPEGLSRAHPRQNLPKIGELLDFYDIALVQEDFAYPDLLREKVRLPFVSPPFVRGELLEFGDGLSFFGRLPFESPKRSKWTSCHGVVDAFHDCLTSKGFSNTRVVLAPGVEVDVYNAHLDAGASVGDRAARAAQLQQLLQAIRQQSEGHAFILGGDFNLSAAEHDLLRIFESTLGARDVCSALRCRDPWRIDRVLVRSSTELQLSPKSWTIDRRFRDGQGRPLSDHLAVAVEIAWSAE